MRSRARRYNPPRPAGAHTWLVVVLGATALLAGACAPQTATPGGDPPPAAQRFAAPSGPEPTPELLPPPPPLPPLPATKPMRVAEAGEWVETDCMAFPEDNYWHADVRGLPTVAPNTPDGSGLAGFPAQDDDPLAIHAGLQNDAGKTITWASDSDPLEWVGVEGPSWAMKSEYSAVEVIEFGPLSHAVGGLLRHRVPSEVLIELSSIDDHALFVDTDACTMTEYIGWSRLPDVLSGQIATVNDLRTNERRLSVRPGWLAPANNGPVDRPIDSPYTWTDPNMSGMGGSDVHAPRNGAGSSGGSSLPTSPGMVRLEEVFADPDGGSEEVDPEGYIDHAIAASLPKRNITSLPSTLDPEAPEPFVWPATRSDGCAESLCLDGSTGSEYHVPMGSRLRLSEKRCSQVWNEPQAERIVEALCNYGVVITDSSGHFSIATERAAGSNGGKWRSEAHRELATITLRDFELVDTDTIAAVDPDLLWESANVWAHEQYGPGGALPGGWYTGTYWRAATNCDRPAHRAMDLVRPPCSDPQLAAVESVVNGPDWWLTDR